MRLVFKRAMVGAVLTSFACVTGVSAAQAASVTFRGSAGCESDRDVVGVWVSSSDGGSGWAEYDRLPGASSIAYFSKTVTVSGSSTTVQVKVGCGGSSGSWASTNVSAEKSVSSTYVYNMWCADPSSGNGTCRGASLPHKADTNHFDAGWCTWGAAKMWKKANNTYPSWYGNAEDWNNNAEDQDFKMAKYPRERTLVVFEDPAPYGHVAWVKSAWVSGSSIKFRVIEMNYPDRYTWTEREVTFGSGMSFIVAPAGPAVTSHA